ncbi:cytidine deaminase [Actinopolymorpha alba]|uniref:cytidine deaminase n=1 Tax=Actinopolymorpha alba TaxID=533267 RepID=UPI0003678724|nr:cytidine deaminase [Actinopolymorpha alba]
MKLDQNLVDAARALLVARYGEAGWGGAAAMYTATGSVLTSVFVEALSDSAGLCIETGAIAEAHKLNEPITASACVVRDDNSPTIRVLASCGTCMERLRFWGPEVEIAVPEEKAPGDWRAYRLTELQPRWWGSSYGAR